jgi:inorganic phosphate transporter, PiT family
MLSLLLFSTTCFLAYANGSNDNPKGVASLFGSDTTDYRTAIAWGTVATFMGSVASIFLAQGLIAAFSGKGLVPAEVAGGQIFLLSVAAGAGGTVLLATLLGFPISTTHGLVGAIVGAGWLAAGSRLNVGLLASTFILPLLVSPLLAVLLAGGLYRVAHAARVRFGIRKDTCVCVGSPVLVSPATSGAMALEGSTTAGTLTVASNHVCESSYVGGFIGVGWQSFMDSAHYLSAGLVSFARGLNDTPKIAALLVVLQMVDVRWGLIAMGAAMAAGGLLSARRVAMTMGRKITGMNHGQGLAANLATGALVIGASGMGLPVSTTHVSVGALFGIGVTTGQADLRVIRNVGLSWVVTLPCAAVIAAGVYALAGAL